MPKVTITHQFGENEIDDLHEFSRVLSGEAERERIDALSTIRFVKQMIRNKRKHDTFTYEQMTDAIAEELADYE